MNEIKEFINKNDEWLLSNSFFLMHDIERLRKFLVRSEYFRMVLDIPGDIVELGVMKGVGLAQFLKLREIFIPGTNKKVVGFDLFSKSNFNITNEDLKNLENHYIECNIDKNTGINTNEISYFFDNMKLTNNRMVEDVGVYELVEGDIMKTIPEYLKKNPGFRISFLYLDMDVEEPTLFALEQLYDRLVRGGIIVFDEYAVEEWGESNAVDNFLKKHKELEIKTLTWARTPTAYIIKK